MASYQQQPSGECGLCSGVGGMNETELVRVSGCIVYDVLPSPILGLRTFNGGLYVATERGLYVYPPRVPSPKTEGGTP